MNIVEEGDTICTTEVSRLTRSTKMLCDIIDQIKEKKLRLMIKDGLTIDCRKGQNRCNDRRYVKDVGSICRN